MDRMPGFYFALWMEDKRSMQMTRLRNVMSDVESGSFSPFSSTIVNQLATIMDMSNEYDRQFISLGKLTMTQADEWCRADLIKRGVITE